MRNTIEGIYITNQIAVDIQVDLPVGHSLKGKTETAPKGDERLSGPSRTLHPPRFARPLVEMPVQELVDRGKVNT